MTLTDLFTLDMQGHGDYLLRPRDIAMPPNKSNDIINSFFTLPHTCSDVRFLNIYFSSLPYKKRNKNSKLLISKMFLQPPAKLLHRCTAPL